VSAAACPQLMEPSNNSYPVQPLQQSCADSKMDAAWLQLRLDLLQHVAMTANSCTSSSHSRHRCGPTSTQHIATAWHLPAVRRQPALSTLSKLSTS
jgi:hypothetical protein